MNLRGLASAIILTALAVILTLTTVIFAPLPLMLLRRNGGRTSFLLGSVMASALLIWLTTPMIVGVFLGAVLLTLVLCESESQNLGYTSSVFVTLLVIVGFGAIATGFAIERYGLDPVEFFRAQITAGAAQLPLPAGETIDKEALIKQVPSAVVILVVFSIWVNSILVTKIEQLLGWSAAFQRHTFVSTEFRTWKLPDAVVWVALLSAAGKFLEVQPEWLHWVAANIFNVMVMLYFFQGFAVIVDFLEAKKVSLIWRLVAYFLIFLQLFLMVSFIGFADLWVGFRKRTKPDKSAVA